MIVCVIERQVSFMSEQTRGKIVIIDNDFDNLDMVCCALFDVYDLYPISDDFTSMTYLEVFLPDLIILNTDLIYAENFSFTKFRNHPLIKNIPFLLITPSGPPPECLQSLSNQLLHPYTLDSLQQAVKAKIIHYKKEKGDFTTL
jgi:PleD family two-component response regulator